MPSARSNDSKSGVVKPLEPVDHARCQADVRSAYNPFIMGGDVGGKWGRCKNKPKWYVREVKAGPDGRKGAMALCDECKPECEKRMPGHATFEPLVGWNAKFHQLYDHPHCILADEIPQVLQDAGADAETASAFAQLILQRWKGSKK
jgi:hypothetical protein